MQVPFPRENRVRVEWHLLKSRCEVTLRDSLLRHSGESRNPADLRADDTSRRNRLDCTRRRGVGALSFSRHHRCRCANPRRPGRMGTGARLAPAVPPGGAPRGVVSQPVAAAGGAYAGVGGALAGSRASLTHSEYERSFNPIGPTVFHCFGSAPRAVSPSEPSSPPSLPKITVSSNASNWGM